MFENIDEIKKIDFTKLFEINGSEVQSQIYDNLNYITIDNFFKNPHDIVDVLKLFPINDKSKFYEKISELKKTKWLQQPGLQQFFPINYLESLSFTLYKLLAEYDYVPYDIENSGDYLRLGRQLSQFVYYSNIFYPGILKISNNNLPHFDQSQFAFNIFLSENVGGGTSFYNLVYNNKRYASLNAVLSETDPAMKEGIKNELNKMNDTCEVAPYDAFEGNEMWEKYHTIEYKFNRLCLYKGNFWHNVYYDANTETNIRYSLSATYSPSMDPNEEHY